MRRATTFVTAVVACLLAGCGVPSGAKELKSVSATPPRPVERVDAVDLWAAPPAAINWDEAPGPDGVQAQVFLYQLNQAEPVLVTGALEFLMYAGRVEHGTAPSTEPLKVWSFTAVELAGRRIRSMVGWGYAAQLGWGRDAPTTSTITLSARYQPPTGSPVYSAPVSIAIPQGVRSGPVKTIIGDPAASDGAALLE